MPSSISSILYHIEASVCLHAEDHSSWRWTTPPTWHDVTRHHHGKDHSTVFSRPYKHSHIASTAPYRYVTCCNSSKETPKAGVDIMLLRRYRPPTGKKYQQLAPPSQVQHISLLRSATDSRFGGYSARLVYNQALVAP